MALQYNHCKQATYSIPATHYGRAPRSHGCALSMLSMSVASLLVHCCCACPEGIIMCSCKKAGMTLVAGAVEAHLRHEG
jgi:hypothetical protein